MKYYWCVNCGYHGDFGFYRQKNAKCQMCEYDELTEIEQDEWDKEIKKKHEANKKDPFYKNFKERHKYKN